MSAESGSKSGSDPDLVYDSALSGRVVSSAVEHCSHTAGATGSIPVRPTIKQ